MFGAVSHALVISGQVESLVRSEESVKEWQAIRVATLVSFAYIELQQDRGKLARGFEKVCESAKPGSVSDQHGTFVASGSTFAHLLITMHAPLR